MGRVSWQGTQGTQSSTHLQLTWPLQLTWVLLAVGLRTEAQAGGPAAWLAGEELHLVLLAVGRGHWAMAAVVVLLLLCLKGPAMEQQVEVVQLL